MFRPKGIARDSEGHLYVVEGLSGMVQVFDRQGQLLYYFGQKGSGFGEFQLPCRFVYRSQRPRVCGRFLPSACSGFSVLRAGEAMITTKTPRHPGKPGSQRRRNMFSLCLSALVVIFLGLAGAALGAQTQTPDVIGMHDLSPHGTSPVKGTLSGSCLYCHAPHSGLNGRAGVAQLRFGTRSSPASSPTRFTASTQWLTPPTPHRPWARTAPSASVAMMVRWRGRRARWSLTGKVPMRGR
jgi:hypothetical protein